MEAQIIPTQQQATNFEPVKLENLARLEGTNKQQDLGSAPSNVEGKQYDDTSTHITPPQAATTRLPSTSIHVLEKVTAVEHINVQHKVMEQIQLGTSIEASIALEATVQADDIAEHTIADENLAQQGDTSSP
jgi:hypothetical protein